MSVERAIREVIATDNEIIDLLNERIALLREQLRLAVIQLESACAIRDAGHAIPPDAIWYEGTYFTILRGLEAIEATKTKP